MSCTLTNCNYIAPRISIWVLPPILQWQIGSPPCVHLVSKAGNIWKLQFSLLQYECGFVILVLIQVCSSKSQTLVSADLKLGLQTNKHILEYNYGTGNPWNGQMGGGMKTLLNFAELPQCYRGSTLLINFLPFPYLESWLAIYLMLPEVASFSRHQN